MQATHALSLVVAEHAHNCDRLAALDDPPALAALVALVAAAGHKAADSVTHAATRVQAGWRGRAGRRDGARKAADAAAIDAELEREAAGGGGGGGGGGSDGKDLRDELFGGGAAAATTQVQRPRLLPEPAH